jgi:hypothetical protein
MKCRLESNEGGCLAIPDIEGRTDFLNLRTAQQRRPANTSGNFGFHLGTPARAFRRSGFTLGNIAASTSNEPISGISDTHNREIVIGNYGPID